ncbi:hypothetical protein MYXO_04004 [Myxococcaceae bacterium]|nr:hypothetical protein MYXO_04004 [Myxococcaceae bacterium]
MSLQGYGIAMVGNTLAEVPFMEFKATAQHRLKKGGFKEKTATGAMFFSFCPFCGRKLEAAGTDGSTPPTGD